jgi:branched-chain amino acid transport system substrate-binding protein
MLGIGRRTVVIILAVAAVVAAACGNSEEDASSTPEEAGGETPGVSDDTIQVGGVASVTNPLGGNYGDTFGGAKAYFEKVNADGGVDGRQIEMVAEKDDSAAGSRNASQVRSLVQEDGVFAVIPVATISFAGASYLADEGVPTFGWNINTEWEGSPNLFGEKGSFLCFDCPAPHLPYLIKESGRSRVGIIAYTAAQSQDCAAGQKASYEEHGEAAGIELVFEDTSLGFGFGPGALDADLREMRDRGVDFLSTCIDGAGSARLAEAIQRAGLDIIQYLPNGYDQSLIDEFGEVLEGSYVNSFTVPFEAEEPPPAMEEYQQAMEDSGTDVNENSLAGWINADLFVTGLRAVADAGDELTRQSLIDAINALEDYDAGGLLAGMDWATAHDQQSERPCLSFLKIENSTFVPTLNEPGKPFVCFDQEEPDFDNPEIRA